MMNVIKYLLCILILPSVLSAQMYNCEGVWTNKPCDGGPIPAQQLTPVINHLPNNPPTNNESMISIYRKLDIDRTKAKRQYGIELEISRANTACLSNEASLEKCQKTVEEFQEKLYQRIQEAKLLEESKKRTKLIEEKNNNDVDIGQLNSVTVYEKENRHHRHRPTYDSESSINIKSGSTELSITERNREEPFVPIPPKEKPVATPFDKNFKPQNRFQAGQ